MTDRHPFMSDREMIQEIREDIKNLARRFTEFEYEVVLKTDLNLWIESNKTTRRWAIGTIITIIAAGISAIVTIWGTM